MSSNGGSADAAAGAATNATPDDVPPTYEDLQKRVKELEHALTMLANAVMSTAAELRTTESLKAVANHIADKFLPENPVSDSADSADEMGEGATGDSEDDGEFVHCGKKRRV